MKPLIIANWKMNPQTLDEAKEIFGGIEKGIKDFKNTCPVGPDESGSFGAEVVICPPFVYLPLFCGQSLDNLKLGAQDCFWAESGAFTGEISPTMLRNLGCEYVILGHSERRIYLKESEEMINQKIKFALSAGLKVILCIGGEKIKKNNQKEVDINSSSDLNNNKCQNLKAINLQLKKDLKGLRGIDFSDLIIVYEPAEAISTVFSSKALQPEEAKVGLICIKKSLNQILGDKDASKIRILYGGSVNSENAKDFILKSGVEGLLIGKASLNSEEFVKIIKNITET